MSTDKFVDLPNNTRIASGLWNKNASGPIDIPFNTKFSEPPVVVISPNWPVRAGVEEETISRVEKTFFQVTSKNAAGDYYVSWMAMGKIA